MSTPMLKQYKRLKNENKDALLLFRLGDFYEAFLEDAKIVSKVLGLTLTGRGKDQNRIPMAGIPHHALPQYLPKLIKAGYKVAIADQLEEASKSKLVKRGVVKIVTAGTLLDEKSLDKSENNYIASIFYNKKSKMWGLSYADLSTGEFVITEHKSKSKLPINLITEVSRIQPRELLISRKEEGFRGHKELNIVQLDDFEFDLEKSKRILLEGFNVKNLKGYGVEGFESGLIPAGVLYEYLQNTQKSAIPHITEIKYLDDSKYMRIDATTIRSLELLYPNTDDGKSVLDSMDNCQTAMGQRLLRQWIMRPLIDRDEIIYRLDCVKELKESRNNRELRSKLDEIVDLERLVARIATGSGNARDLLFLKNSLISVKDLLDQVKDYKNILKNKPSDSSKDKISKIIDLLEKSISENAPITITDGGMIKASFDKDLAKIIKEAEEGKAYISNLKESERESTGISNLKVSFNQVFGYYIEVTRANLDKVPDRYIRKQTLANAERFITDDLKKWEEKVLSAQDKASELEYKIFENVRKKVVDTAYEIQELAKFVGLVDVISNFAYLAVEFDYTMPSIRDDDSNITSIKDGRHVVVERQTDVFIPNDLKIGDSVKDTMIITGPNMSGKSTYIRQIALIVLLAQIGSYVPAKEAIIAIADRIFTRVGSADNLASGESTFMVEMSEAANILNNATEKSLIILDEIGRGTSTYDGLSLAWAIVEFLSQEVKARTLFATHYHELTLLEDKLPNVKNYNVEVKETEDEVLFMHKIIRGATDRSYGIYVAKIAGLPKKVISRANTILKELEEDKLEEIVGKEPNYQDQLGFESILHEDKLAKEIRSLNIDELSPLEALLKLKELQELDEDTKE